MHDEQEMPQILYRVDRYYAISWFVVQSTLEMDTGFIVKIDFSSINSFIHCRVEAIYVISIVPFCNLLQMNAEYKQWVECV